MQRFRVQGNEQQQRGRDGEPDVAEAEKFAAIEAVGHVARKQKEQTFPEGTAPDP